MARWFAGLIVAVALCVGGGALAAEPVAGLWDGSIQVKDGTIPFRLYVTGAGPRLRANFFDGDRPTTPSSSASLVNGDLTITFASYNTQLKAKLADGVLRGVYGQAGQLGLAIEAHRHVATPPISGGAPIIGGDWIIPYKSPKGEEAWRLIVNQNGPRASATILRIDGDTGTLSGEFQNGVFRLSHFAGERPLLLEVTPKQDGLLDLNLVDPSSHKQLQAVRSVVAQAQGLAAPSDPKHFTAVRDPSAPFKFSFPDLNGKVVSNSDARFKGKVVVVNIMGSWCPNCHDEAPFLSKLYKDNRARGLEIVALDFEQADQLQNSVRLRAFLARYGISYTVLLAGQPKEAAEKLPQAVNLNAWPTTFVIGRDGKVRSVHVGFTSPGSGPYDLKLREDFRAEIARLLAERRS